MVKYTFRGKRVLLTGACGGLGSALTKELAKRDASLVLSGRSADKLYALIRELPRETSVIPIPADLSLPGEARKLALKAIEAVGAIDILINNAGIGYHALMEETSDDKIRHLYEVNTYSPMALIKAILPKMKAQRTGRIVNIVSCTGHVPIPTTGVYGASKIALAKMAAVMRLELAPFGIDITNIYPGPVNTGFDKNALRENGRIGLRPAGAFGVDPDVIAKRIIDTACGPPGEIWIDRRSKWKALASMIWPKLADRVLSPLRNKVLIHSDRNGPAMKRRWRLWQLESSVACNLNCIMCPWKEIRHQKNKEGDLPTDVWEAVRPYLPEVQSIDFTGGGEPLLQPMLADWIEEAHEAGCKTGFLTNGIILNREMVSRFINAGLDWIAFSIDGASEAIYEEVRKGSDFQKVCENVSTVAELRVGLVPKIMINFVLMPINFHQVEEIIRLANKLGADQVNFKQCDVIRGDHGRGYGLFTSKENREVRRLKKALGKALRLAKKLKIKTMAFAFTPDELPVCAQDPRDSLFIRHDGYVAPCINLACGGLSSFLGKDVTIPEVHYGRLPEKDLMDLWETDQCKFYREQFNQRMGAYDNVIANSSFEASLIKLQETLQAAQIAMPQPPEGCQVCHYLYDI